MGFRKVIFLGMLLLSLLVAFRSYILLILILFVIGIIFWFLVRWLADLFWWGKDKGKW